MKKLLLIPLLAFSLCATAWGATITVGTSGADYTTITEAVTAASAGDEIQLITEITEEGILVGKAVTIDLNGHTISSNSTLTHQYVIANTTNVTVKNGTIHCASQYYVLNNTNYNSFAIWPSGGTLTLTSVNTTGCGYGIYNNGYSNLAITGGSIYGVVYGIYNKNKNIELTNATVSSLRYGMYNEGGTVTVSGGTIASTGAYTNSYALYNYNNGNVQISDASVSTLCYGLYNYGGTMTVSNTAVESTGTYSISVAVYNYNGSIDFTNGSITSKCYGVNNYSGTVTIDGTTVSSTGTYNISFAIFNLGTVEISSGTISSVSTDIATIHTTNSLTISGGNLTGTRVIRNEGEVNFSGGTINASLTGIVNASSSTVTLSGSASISAATYGISNNGTATINGGTITITAEDASTSTFAIWSNATVNVNGGTLTGKKYGIYSSGTLTTNGGVIQIDDDIADNITSYAVYSTGNVTMGNGTGYPSISGKMFGLYNDAGTVTINKGSIIASKFAAVDYCGIMTIGGTANLNATTTISIYGNGTSNSATLNITGGNISGVAMGIAGAAANGGTTINISGGTIEAYDNGKGYAIHHPQAGNLNISGGTITGDQDALNLFENTIPSFTGGTFSNNFDPSYCASGYGVKANTYDFTVYPTVTTNADGWATYAIDAAIDVSESGATVYRGVVEGDALNLYNDLTSVPAGEGLVIHGDLSTPYFFTKLSETPAAITNDLIGCVEATTPAAGMNFVLSKHNDEVAFYEFRGTQIPAHKAYLNIPAAAQAPKRIRMVTDNATDVENVQQSEISSQKVLRDGQVIIIRNGVEYNVAGQVIR